MSNTKLITIAVLAAFLGGALYLYGQGRPQEGSMLPNGAADWQAYESDEFGLSFKYPPRYFLTVRDTGSPQRARHSLVLMEDTQENRDLAEGRVTEPREGPPTINLDLFQNNLDNYEAETWIRGTNDSNFKLSPDGTLIRAELDGEDAFLYRWDGLYPGLSVVAVRPDWVHMWSVSYMNPEDQILDDWSGILDTVRFK